MKQSGGSAAGTVGLSAASANAGAMTTVFTALARWQQGTSIAPGFYMAAVMIEVLQLCQFFYSPWWDHNFPTVKESAYFVGFWNFGFFWDSHYWGLGGDLANYIVYTSLVLAVMLAAMMFMMLQMTDVLSILAPGSAVVEFLFRSIGSWLFIPLLQTFYAAWYCHVPSNSSTGLAVVSLFPQSTCWSGVHIGSVVVSCIGVLFTILIGGSLSILMGNNDATSQRWGSRAHLTVDVLTTLYKFLAATLFHIFVPYGYKLPFTGLMAIATLPVLISLAVMLPFHRLTANRFYCALYSVLLFLAVENTVAQSRVSRWYITYHVHSQVVLVGIPIAALLGSALPWIRVSAQLLYYAQYCKKFGYAPQHKAYLPFRRGMVSGEARMLPHRYAHIDREILRTATQEEMQRRSRAYRQELADSEIVVPYIHDVHIPSDIEVASRFIGHLQKEGIHTSATARMLSFACKIFIKGIVYFKRNPLVQYHFACYLSTVNGRSQLALELLAELMRDTHQNVPLIVAYPVFKLSTSLRGLFGLRDAAYEKSITKVRHQHRSVLSDIYQFWGKMLESTDDVVSVGLLSSQISTRKISTNNLYTAHITDSTTPNRDLLHVYSLFLENIMLESSLALQVKAVADDVGAMREQKLNSLEQSGRTWGQGGSIKTNSSGSQDYSGITTTLNQIFEDIRLKEDSGASGGKMDAGSSLRGCKFILGAILGLLLLTSGTIAGLQLYIAQYADWQSEAVTYLGRAHAELYHSAALAATCSSMSQQCPQLFTGGPMAASSATATTASSGSGSLATGQTDLTSCTLPNYLTCLNRLRISELSLRESQNSVTYGDFGIEGSYYGLQRTEAYTELLKKQFLVMQPLGSFQFDPVEPERELKRGTPEIWQPSTGWMVLHSASLAVTDLIAQLSLGSAKGIESDFLEQFSEVLHQDLTTIRTKQLESSEATQRLAIVIAMCGYSTGILILAAALLGLRSVLNDVASSKVLILRLFKLIPLPVQQSLMSDARQNFEAFTKLGEKEGQEQEELHIGDTDSDKEDEDEDRKKLDPLRRDSDDSKGSDDDDDRKPLPSPRQSGGANTSRSPGGGSAILKGSMKLPDFDNEWSLDGKDPIFDMTGEGSDSGGGEQRKQSLFFFGTDNVNLQGPSAKGGAGKSKRSLTASLSMGMSITSFAKKKPVSILKPSSYGGENTQQAGGGKKGAQRKRKLPVVKKVQFEDEVLQKEKITSAKATRRMAEPTLLLENKANQVVEDFARTMKDASQQEQQDFHNKRERKASDVEKVLSKGQAPAAQGASKQSEKRSFLTRVRSTLFICITLMFICACTGIGLTVAASDLNTKLAEADATMSDDVKQLLAFQSFIAEQLVEAHYFVITGDLTFYHAYYEKSLKVHETALKVTKTVRSGEDKKLIRIALDGYALLSRNAEIAMAIAYRALGVDPTKVPFLSTMHWDTLPLTPELKYRFARSLSRLPLYPPFSEIQQWEYEYLYAAASSENTTIANMSASATSAAQDHLKARLKEVADRVHAGENEFILQEDFHLLLGGVIGSYLTSVSADLKLVEESIAPLMSAAMACGVMLLVLALVSALSLIVLFRNKPPGTDLFAPFGPIDNSSWQHPINFLALFVLVVLVVCSGVTISAGAQMTENIHDVAVIEADLQSVSSHFNRSQVETVKFMRAAAWYTIEGHQLAEVPLRDHRSSAKIHLDELYTEVAPYLTADRAHAVPTKSEFLASYQNLQHIADVAIYLIAHAINVPTNVDPYIDSYDVKKEPLYATDAVKYQFVLDPLQYTTSGYDLTRNSSVLAAMARHTFTHSRSHEYRERFSTLLVDLEETTFNGFAALRTENEAKREMHVIELLVAFSVAAAFLFIICAEPKVRKMTQVDDPSVSTMMSTLFTHFNRRNFATIVLLSMLLTIQIILMGLTNGFPASAARAVSVGYNRATSVVLSINVVEHAFSATADNAVAALYFKQQDLLAVIRRLEEDRATIVTDVDQWTYGKAHLASDAQDAITYGGTNSLSQQFQAWIDLLNVFQKTDVSLQVTPVSATSPSGSTVTFTGLTSAYSLDAATKSDFATHTVALRAALETLMHKIDESNVQYLADVHSQSTLEVRVPAIICLVVMVAALFFCGNVIFFPMVDELLLEARGTGGMLNMIPLSVRPFVPKIGTFMETGVLVETEEDLKAYDRPAFIEQFRQVFHQTATPVAEAHRILEESPKACILIDQKGLIYHFNENFSNLLGYDETFLGENVRQLMMEPLRSMHDSFLLRFVEKGTSRLVGSGRDVPALKADGELLHVFLHLAEAARDNGELFFLGILEPYDVNKVLRVTESVQ